MKQSIFRAWRPSIRSRLVLTLGFGGFAVSAVLALVTFGFTRTYLVQQREDSATRQAYANARLVRDALRAQGTNEQSALVSLDLPSDSKVVLERNGQWFGNSVAIGKNQIPVSLRNLVNKNQPGHQRVQLLGEPRFVIGLPVPSEDAQYYEVFSLSELKGSIDTVGLSLLAAAAITTALAAFVGLWAGRRVLRPIEEVSVAATRIAGGDLTIRLDAGGDKDLEALTNSFNRMVDALQQRIARDARFVADVSHELRSPVTTLATAAELLQSRREELSPRDQQALDLLVAEVGRFRRVVEELLELSTGDSGVAELVLEAVNLPELIGHLVPRGNEVCEVTFASNIANEVVLLDKRRVERMLVNVLNNGRTHGHGLERVAVERKDQNIRITIDDKGPGVPSSERGKVFDRFFRGAAAGRRGSETGAGLGLSLVREHSELHGGRVWVEDAPGGRGARFVIELPWRKP